MTNQTLILSSLGLILSFLTSTSCIWMGRNKLTFFPIKRLQFYPSNLNYENIVIRTNDYCLNGWYFPGNNCEKLMIYSHGNAGNISHRLHFIEFWRKFLSQDYDIFLYDYIGFGESKICSEKSSDPTVAMCLKSLEIVVEYWTSNNPWKQYNNNQIALFGESIGGAISALVSSNSSRMFEKIILQSTFTSLKAMGRIVSNNILYPFLIFLPDELNCKLACKKLHKKNVKLIVMHSKIDEIIPYSMSQELRKYATSFVELQGTHNNPYLNDNVALAIL